ncbi:kinetochore complex Sim4 subunit Fta1-domain-containing protein [Phyllosticta citribraziliensis]|uniref:Kinetochore complex Sim4 subunit Fta1-domain-containing protein n=1 Tax=Phyllosticta citribraziliensis TaxID=989973 RepID=A0ABR1LW40_9PEZI
MADDDPVPDYPLYNSTFSAYRISPLYHGSNPLLQSRSLRAHARRLKDILRGDTLRGVDVGFLDVGDNRGSLEDCTWDLIGDEKSWERIHRENEDEEEPGEFTQAPIVKAHEARGIHVQLRYQKATYSALILRDPEKPSPSSLADFTSLPLLLVRMPSGVRDTFVDHLSTTFDARVAPLKLHSSFLSSTLETLLQQIDADASIDTVADVLKGPLQLQLSFPSIFHAGTPALLRGIDIRIAQDDVSEYLSRGTQLVTADPSILHPPQTQHSYHNHPPALTGPFSAALSAYLSAHLALPLTHASIHVSKLVIPPLVALSSDAKVKLVNPASAPASVRAALRALFQSLVAYASTAPLADGIGAGNAAPRVVLPLPRPAKARTKTAGKAGNSADAANDGAAVMADATAGLVQPLKASKRRQQQQLPNQPNQRKRENNNNNTNSTAGGVGGRRTNGAAPGTKKKRRRGPVTDGTADGDAADADDGADDNDDDDLDRSSAETSPSLPSSASKRARRDARERVDREDDQNQEEEQDDDDDDAEDELSGSHSKSVSFKGTATQTQSQPSKTARGVGVGVGDDGGTATSPGSSNANAHAQGRQYSVPAEPPPPYELHDPARAATVAGGEVGM